MTSVLKPQAPTTSAIPAWAEAWAAITTRNKALDGIFFYAVKTTGVVCKPSCGARTPKPDNVSLFPDVASARAAGFRPCKRCKPEARLSDDEVAVATALRALNQAEAPIKLEALAAMVGLSPFHFHRLFKARTGLTPKAYFEAERAKRVRAHLAQGSSVTEAYLDAGFGSSGRFYAKASDALGMAPKIFAQGAPGQKIAYALGQSSLGLVLAAATDKGLCALLIGDDAQALRQDLNKRFPKAQVSEDQTELAPALAAVIAKIEAPGTSFALPLDLQGTAFELKVWRALQAIPAGATRSYGAIAQDLDMPKAARAIARACANNKVAVVVPCHRVVRGDGDLAGYRWGLARKRALLAKEREGKTQA